jgi:hypothetical protein
LKVGILLLKIHNLLFLAIPSQILLIHRFYLLDAKAAAARFNIFMAICPVANVVEVVGARVSDTAKKSHRFAMK